MRGTIIMWRRDKGVVTAGSLRYDFDVSHWQGTISPVANMTVEIATADGRLTGLTPVNDVDVAKEIPAAMTGEGGKVARAIFENVGRDVAIAYGVFFIIAMFASLISTGVFIDNTLADLLGGDMTRMASSGWSGKGTMLVLLASATVAVPYVWKHKSAPLAFTSPLLFTILGFWPLYKQHRAEQQAMEALAEFGQFGQLAQQMGGGATGPFDNLGIGAWLLITTVIFLAFRGVMRFLARA